MYQIIKCYRSKKDYIHNTNFATLEFNFCKINHNPEYKEFANNYARGIVEGLRRMADLNQYMPTAQYSGLTPTKQKM